MGIWDIVMLKCVFFSKIILPEKIEATAAMMKEMMTPGPATFLATIPATKYIPVPTQLPTPNDVRSNVSRHFCNK
jgi:hypothetical protein